ncbi:MAG: hypothetical protein IJ366_01780 [Clostridia bacterium]|nr:hypothetical protein [Clostridia bacterium]
MTENELKFVSYLARDGMKLEDIRKTVGIKKDEWRKYLRENPEEKRRLELLRKTTDYAVEDALLKRALGYTSEEHRESEKPNGSEAVTTYKEVPPDVRAAALWLKFRRADMWDGKQNEKGGIDVEEAIAELDREANNEDE